MIELYTVKNSIHSLLKKFNNVEEANSFIKSCELSPRRKQMAKKEGRRIYNKRSPLFDCDNHYIKTNGKQEDTQSALINLGSTLSGGVSASFIEGSAILCLYPKYKYGANAYMSQFQKNSVFARSSQVTIASEFIRRYENNVTLDITITKVFEIREKYGNYVQNIEFNVISDKPENKHIKLINKSDEEGADELFERYAYLYPKENKQEYSFKDNKKKAIIVICIKLLDKFTKLCNNFKNKLNSIL